MKTGILAIRKTTETKIIPDGVYDGTWGGYTVRLTANLEEYELTTIKGIRTPGTPCTVFVSGGKVSVETCGG